MSVHVGQQAIVDASGLPVAYELLFRSSGGATSADVADGERATAQVLVTTFLEFGLHDLVGDRLAFVNLPRAFLVGDLPLPFCPGQVVLEVLEDVPADEAVVSGVTRLVEQGHLIALDDVTADRSRDELLHLAAYVKIDLLATDRDDLPALVARCAAPGRRVIAEKVETAEQLERCRHLGVELFQGYLVDRPRTLSQKSLTPSQLACVRLVTLLADPDVVTGDVVAAVEADPSLTVKVLQAANSTAAGLARRPSSVREAVVLVGLQTLQAWATLLSLGGAGSAVPLAAALSRGRMCQLLAGEDDASAAFLTGLLSGLTEALGVPADVLLAQLPVARAVSDALLAGAGPLADVLTVVLAYEAGSLPETEAERARLAYLHALVWTGRTSAVAGAA